MTKKVTGFLVVLLLMAWPYAIYAQTDKGGVMAVNSSDLRIMMTFGNDTVIIKMHDNPTSLDFISLLPMTLTLEDYHRTEKISYLPKKLSTKDAPNGSDPAVGDFTYYAPWGNLAIFYRDFGYSGGLIIMGSIESGTNKLKERQGSFNATFELLK